MVLRADKRGVSEVIGSILVFGLLIALLSLVQVYAIPNANAGIEHEHSQAVQEDFDRLGESIDAAARSDETTAVGFRLGTQYPTRLATFNPPDPAGSLRTGDPGTVAFVNATAVADRPVRFDDSIQTYSSRPLVYEPDYNEYDGAPRVVREAGVRYDDYGDAAVVDEQRFIDDNELTLTMFDGDYREQRAGSERIEPVVVSGPSEAVPIENAVPGEPLVVALPTSLDQPTWNETLAPERVENGGHVTALSVVEGTPRNTLLVELEPGVRYQLETAVIGFEDAERADPNYMRPVGGSDVDIGSNAEATVRVYDRYNNPVSGVTLEANLTRGDGRLKGANGDTVTLTTGPNGNATVTYRAPNKLEAAVVEFNFSDSPTPPAASVRRPIYVGFENPPVSVVSAEPGSTADEVNLTVQNLGPEREVLGIQLHETRRLSAEEVASRSGLSGLLGGIGDDLADLVGSDFSLIQKDIVSTSPGPQVIEDVDRGSADATDNQHLEDVNAVAGGPVAPFGDVLDPIGRYETGVLGLEFVGDDAFGDSDVLVVRVEVYYSGGLTEQYTVQVPAP